jgi:hypothetical protein
MDDGVWYEWSYSKSKTWRVPITSGCQRRPVCPCILVSIGRRTESSGRNCKSALSPMVSEESLMVSREALAAGQPDGLELARDG